MPSDLQRRANQLEAAGHFIGKPRGEFHTRGARQLFQLISEGLLPEHRVLDIGCGALRAGYWLIHFLEPGHYCGIEPRQSTVEAALETLVGRDAAARQAPRFDPNDRFDLTVFGERFDFFLAASIWIHADRDQIVAMLDGFCATAAPGAVFLVNYAPAPEPERAYRGSGWVGRSHDSDRSGWVYHDVAWIHARCAERGLQAVHTGEREAGEHWLRITVAATG